MQLTKLIKETKKMLYLIDNYDSFTYNLYQLIGTLTNQPITVIKNDELSVTELVAKKPAGLIFSPGPGCPKDAGNMPDFLRQFIGKVPILGVCLGHQAIGEFYGAKVVHAPTPIHGKPSKITLITQDSLLFNGCPPIFDAARYHSLVLKPDTINNFLKVTAIADDDTIQAIENQEAMVYGVQFHPESIMTNSEIGKRIIINFLNQI